MNKHKLSQILAILVIFSLMSGCGSRVPVKTATPLIPPTATEQPATATLPPPTPVPTATPPPTLIAVAIVPGSFPVGTYKCEQGRNKYTYKFLAEGRYNEEIIAYIGDAFAMESEAGTYTVSGDQITIAANPTPGDCQGKEIGTYTWSLVGQELSLKSLGDKCAIREYTNESCQWVMQP